jgi:hypothetical protein
MEEGGHGGRRWSRRSLRLGERVRRSICGSNRMDGELGWPEAELAKNGDGGGDLSHPGLLRCQGGGPWEAAEDEGMPVLLGGRSVWMKGSTGVHNGVVCKGRGGKGEKGGGVGSWRGKEKKGWSDSSVPRGGGERGWAMVGKARGR